MILFGLTGGVGMGKSTTARFIADQGVPVVDTDQLARDVVAPGQPALGAMVKAFGREILLPDGQLNRSRLADSVFADPDQRRRLEAIVHPAIRERWQSEVRAWREERIPAGVVMIPLLLETRAESLFDRILCSACTRDTQEQRLADRGWNQEHLQRRIEAQWPVASKMAVAHGVIWTEGSLEVHRQQVLRLLHHEGLSTLD